MLAKRKIFYMLMGGIVTCLGIVIALVAVSPMFASSLQDSVFIMFGNTKLVIPVLTTASPGDSKPTPTPSVLVNPPISNPPPATMDAISNPPIEKDLSPELPLADKAAVVLQYPDGKRTQVFMAPDKVEQYLSHLPKGVLLVTIIPPASLMGQPPTPDMSQLPKESIVITAAAGITPTFEWPPTPPNYSK